MANPSAIEQLTLEFINQARLDPRGEFGRIILGTNPLVTPDPDVTSALNFFNVDIDELRAQLQQLDSAPPLAWNSQLNNAATAHSQLMIDFDDQEHQLPGEPGLGARVTAAGYNWSTVGENIFAFTENAFHGHAALFVDWGLTATGIQQPPGHRNNIMNPVFTEVGIGIIRENDAGTDVGPFVQTQDFATRPDYVPQFLGVVYDDQDNNDFYSIGEGLGGIRIRVDPVGPGATTSVKTPNAGGYAVEPSSGPGQYILIFSGTGLDAAVRARVVMGSENVKVDLVDGATIRSSADTMLLANALDLELLGDGDIKGTGNGAANTITGGRGDNRLVGGGGNDTLAGGGGNDTLAGGGGNDRLTGGGGRDVLNGDVGKDRLVGGAGNDRLVGGGGRDVLEGQAGNDRLLGGGGNDVLNGGGGRDTLDGGAGNDRLTGGGGPDVFVFGKAGGNDTVKAFQDGADLIDLSAFNFASVAAAKANAANVGADLVFDFGADGTLTIEDISRNQITGQDLIL